MNGKYDESQMDEHLVNIHRETTAALVGFEMTGSKIDKNFINNFLSVSIDR